MIHMQNTKIVNVTVPAVKLDDASAVTVEIDTIDFDYCTIFCQLGVTDIAMTVLKVQESDTSGSGMADVTGLVWGTSSNIAGSTSTLPIATNDDTWFVFDIDLKGRKRYLDVVATMDNGTLGGFFVAHAILSRAKDGPTTAAQRGATEVLRV